MTTSSANLLENHHKEVLSALYSCWDLLLSAKHTAKDRLTEKSMLEWPNY